MPDEGAPRAALAGGTTDRSIALRVCRAGRVVEGAVAVRDALSAAGARILDPATAGGCGDAPDHGPLQPGLRRPPPVRVVRARVAAGDLAKVDGLLDGLPGLVRVHAARLGGAPAGEITLDVHVVP